MSDVPWKAGGRSACPTNQRCHPWEERSQQPHQTPAEHWGNRVLVVETGAPSCMTLTIYR